MSAEDAAREPTLVAGQVGRPHGLDGRFRVTRPKARLLPVGATVDVGGTPRELLERGGTDDAPILRLQGVGDRDAAEALRGTELRVPRALAPELEDDEHWTEDLVGLRVLDGAGERLGTVARVLDLPSCAVLGVQRPGQGELLVPLVRDAVPELDVDAGWCAVDRAFLGLDD